jgi:hypothetical protein
MLVDEGRRAALLTGILGGGEPRDEERVVGEICAGGVAGGAMLISEIFIVLK